MKRLIVSIAILLLTATLTIAYQTPGDVEYLSGLALLSFVEQSDIIVIGTVANKNYVSRPGFTTDITIRIETLVKGKPNLGNNHVIFMIQGGRGYSEAHDKVLRLEVSGEPKFALGERTMVFLSNRDTSGYHATYPYNHLHVIREMHGKKRIKDNKVGFSYLNAEDDVDYVKFPLELTTKLAQAYVKDKDAASALENEIKTLVLSGTNELPETLITRLTTQSQTILDREEE